MRRIIIVLVCAMIAPLAFAQTKKTNTQQNVTRQPVTTTETATTQTAGTIRTYTPGKTMVVDSTQGPVSFALGTSTQVVNSAGNAINSALTPGERVRVFYTGTGVNRTAERVVVGD